MKVLLVEPSKTTWKLMGGNYVSPPLGLAQLAAVLEKEDIKVGVVDCNARVRLSLYILPLARQHCYSSQN